MGDFGPFFLQNVFFMSMMEPQKKFGPNFLGFTPPKQAILPNPLRPACHFAEIGVVPRRNPNSRKAMTGALYMLNRVLLEKTATHILCRSLTSTAFEPWRRAVPV